VKIIRESSDVDILLIGEGTYPYVRGGVSSWIHQLVSGLPEFKFGIVFLGARPSDYGDILYKLPDNLVHLQVHYLFGNTFEDNKIKPVKDKKSFERIQELYEWIVDAQDDMPQELKGVEFYNKDITKEHFLYSKQSWDFITQKYLENCPDLPFIDYFWTVRNIHMPVWIIADIAQHVPKCKIIHSPSTGYAGFLASLYSFEKQVPYILTEHGIYTRERKIDMLTADWINIKKPTLLKQSDEFNYIKQMWVKFFEKIGLMSYKSANPIISLFSRARKIQIDFGADPNRCIVVPNGVDVDGLKKACLDKREKKIPKVITLIGRVVPIKDIKTFIRAMRIVINEIPDVEAWVVGPTEEDPIYAKECEQMIETLQLKDNFHLLGFQNIKDILPKSGLMTLTSVSEGMPLTILEGFAAGLPCIATDVGSCYDLIYGGLGEEDEALGAAGAVTRIADPSSLAKNYIKFLTDEKLWSKAQEVALKRVNTYYRQDQFLDTYRKMYQEVL
jgi:glycosyltransferase involved in cell wall biosynthesis